MISLSKGILVKAAIIIGVSFGGFVSQGQADEAVNANEGLMPVAQNLKEKMQQDKMEDANKWDNTKNYMKRGFKGSCTKDCVENKKLCDDQEKKKWCLANCEGKYKIVKTGKLFNMEEKCPSSMMGQMGKSAGKMFK